MSRPTPALFRLDGRRLRALFRRLYQSYGPQHWWPERGGGAFEVMVGAILTQNTAWKNADRAIGELRQHGCLNRKAILRLRRDQLAQRIRSSGYFNLKAERLHNFCRWLQGCGGMAALVRLPTGQLREELLEVRGVGPETADDILLYAFARPVFVIDAYTRRLLAALGMAQGDEPYESLRLAFERALGEDVPMYNEYHALIVRHAKERCIYQPDCRRCRVEQRICA